MIGLYGGRVPAWLPGASHALFRRESLRRRCALGQALTSSFPCTVYCAQSLLTSEVVGQVFAAWAAARFHADNVVTGLYLALEEVLATFDGIDAVVDLLRFEALAIGELRTASQVGLPTGVRRFRAAMQPTELYVFEHAVTEIHGRMTLYAGACAPASFVRDYEFPRRRVYVARAMTPRGWSLWDASDDIETETETETETEEPSC